MIADVDKLKLLLRTFKFHVFIRPVIDNDKISSFSRGLAFQEEEDDLSDAFKKRLGLNSAEVDRGLNEVTEVTLVRSRDVELDATVNKIKFEKFVKTSFEIKTQPPSCSNKPLTQPLLAALNDIDQEVLID